MVSRAILFLGLLLTMVVLISSQVAATEETNGAVNDAKYPGGGYPGGGNGGYPGGGRGGNGGGNRRYCRYGCCGRNYYRGGCRCCRYAGQNIDAEFQAKPGN